MDTHKKYGLFNRCVSTFLVAAFLMTGNAPFSTAFLPENTSNAKILPHELKSVVLPETLGKIKENFQGLSGRAVILIQDAHAIPAAQRSIQQIIEHFQSQYGVELTAVEGASSALDMQIFRSFPDKERLKEVFDFYMDRGELTGPAAAAIFNQGKNTYRGIENWELYENGLGLYLDSLKNFSAISVKLKDIESNLQKEKEAVYSPRLLEADRQISAFYENEIEFAEVLKFLSSVKSPEKGTELAALIETIGADQKSLKDLEGEVKETALKIQPVLEGKDLAAFNGKFQQFQTTAESLESFALYLREVAARHEIPLQFSSRLDLIMNRHRQVRDMEGQKVFKDFDVYAREVKSSLFENEIQRKLDQETSRLILMKRLAKLELSHEQWSEFKSLKPDSELNGMFKSHLAFYDNAKKREDIFSKNLNALLSEDRQKSSLLVAGGFHAAGLIEKFKTEGTSFLLITPHISEIPKTIHYQDLMKGSVSWKEYFRVENGKINLYSAFVRAARDRLLSEEMRPEVTLKSWRDQMIRDLASQGRITDLARYASFIDEVPHQTKNNPEWFNKIQKFVEGLRGLDAKGEMTAPNILNLTSPTALQAAGGNASVSQFGIISSELFFPARSEVRSSGSEESEKKITKGEKTKETPLPVLSDGYAYNRNLGGVKKVLEDTIDWLIAQGYPYPEILRNYKTGVTYARETAPGFFDWVPAFGKHQPGGGAASFAVLNVKQLLYWLDLIKQVKSRDYFMEIFASVIIQEAWGWHYHQRRTAAEFDEGKNLAIGLRDTIMNKISVRTQWPVAEEIKQLLKANSQKIFRLSALAAGPEWYERKHFRDALLWAEEKGLYSPNAANQAVEALPRRSKDIDILRQGPLAAWGAKGDDASLMRDLLSGAAGLAMPHYFGNGKNLTLLSYALLFLGEIALWEETNGQRGLAGEIPLMFRFPGSEVSRSGIAQNQNIIFTDTAVRFLPEVEKLTDAIDRQTEARSELRASFSQEQKEVVRRVYSLIAPSMTRYSTFETFLNLQNPSQNMLNAVIEAFETYEKAWQKSWKEEPGPRETIQSNILRAFSMVQHSRIDYQKFITLADEEDVLPSRKVPESYFLTPMPSIASLKNTLMRQMEIFSEKDEVEQGIASQAALNLPNLTDEELGLYNNNAQAPLWFRDGIGVQGDRASDGDPLAQSKVKLLTAIYRSLPWIESLWLPLPANVQPSISIIRQMLEQVEILEVADLSLIVDVIAALKRRVSLNYSSSLVENDNGEAITASVGSVDFDGNFVTGGPQYFDLFNVLDRNTGNIIRSFFPLPPPEMGDIDEINENVAISSLQVFPNGDVATFSTEDDAVLVWDSASMEMLHRFFVDRPAHLLDNRALADGRLAVVSFLEGARTVHIVDGKTGALIRATPMLPDDLKNSVLRDSLAAAVYQGWGRSLILSNGKILNISFSQKNDSAEVSSVTRTLQIWNPETGTLERQFELPFDDDADQNDLTQASMNHAQLLTNGTIALAMRRARGSYIYILNPVTGSVIKRFTSMAKIHGLASLPNGYLVAHSMQQVFIFDPETSVTPQPLDNPLTPLHVFTGQDREEFWDAPALSPAVGADGRVLSFVDWDHIFLGRFQHQARSEVRSNKSWIAAFAVSVLFGLAISWILFKDKIIAKFFSQAPPIAQVVPVNPVQPEPAKLRQIEVLVPEAAKLWQSYKNTQNKINAIMKELQPILDSKFEGDPIGKKERALTLKLAPLKTELGKIDQLLKSAIEKIIKDYGQAAVPEVVRLSNQEDFASRETAVHLLSVIKGQEAFERLLEMTQDEDRSLRRLIFQSFNGFPEDPRALNALIMELRRSLSDAKEFNAEGSDLYRQSLISNLLRYREPAALEAFFWAWENEISEENREIAQVDFISKFAGIPSAENIRRTLVARLKVINPQLKPELHALIESFAEAMDLPQRDAEMNAMRFMSKKLPPGAKKISDQGGYYLVSDVVRAGNNVTVLDWVVKSPQGIYSLVTLMTIEKGKGEFKTPLEDSAGDFVVFENPLTKKIVIHRVDGAQMELSGDFNSARIEGDNLIYTQAGKEFRKHLPSQVFRFARSEVRLNKNWIAAFTVSAIIGLVVSWILFKDRIAGMLFPAAPPIVEVVPQTPEQLAEAPVERPEQLAEPPVEQEKLEELIQQVDRLSRARLQGEFEVKLTRDQVKSSVENRLMIIETLGRDGAEKQEKERRLSLERAQTNLKRTEQLLEEKTEKLIKQEDVFERLLEMLPAAKPSLRLVIYRAFEKLPPDARVMNALIAASKKSVTDPKEFTDENSGEYRNRLFYLLSQYREPAALDHLLWLWENEPFDLGRESYSRIFIEQFSKLGSREAVLKKLVSMLKTVNPDLKPELHDFIDKFEEAIDLPQRDAELEALRVSKKLPVGAKKISGHEAGYYLVSEMVRGGNKFMIFVWVVEIPGGYKLVKLMEIEKGKGEFKTPLEDSAANFIVFENPLTKKIVIRRFDGAQMELSGNFNSARIENDTLIFKDGQKEVKKHLPTLVFRFARSEARDLPRNEAFEKSRARSEVRAAVLKERFSEILDSLDNLIDEANKFSAAWDLLQQEQIALLGPRSPRSVGKAERLKAMRDSLRQDFEQIKDIDSFRKYLIPRDMPSPFQEKLREAYLSSPHAAGVDNLVIIFASPDDPYAWSLYFPWLIDESSASVTGSMIPSGVFTRFLLPDKTAANVIFIQNSMDDSQAAFTFFHEFSHARQSSEALELYKLPLGKALIEGYQSYAQSELLTEFLTSEQTSEILKNEIISLIDKMAAMLSLKHAMLNTHSDEKVPEPNTLAEKVLFLSLQNSYVFESRLVKTILQILGESKGHLALKAIHRGGDLTNLREWMNGEQYRLIEGMFSKFYLRLNSPEGEAIESFHQKVMTELLLIFLTPSLINRPELTDRFLDFAERMNTLSIELNDIYSDELNEVSAAKWIGTRAGVKNSQDLLSFILETAEQSILGDYEIDKAEDILRSKFKLPARSEVRANMSRRFFLGAGLTVVVGGVVTVGYLMNRQSAPEQTAPEQAPPVETSEVPFGIRVGVDEVIASILAGPDKKVNVAPIIKKEFLVVLRKALAKIKDPGQVAEIYVDDIWNKLYPDKGLIDQIKSLADYEEMWNALWVLINFPKEILVPSAGENQTISVKIKWGKEMTEQVTDFLKEIYINNPFKLPNTNAPLWIDLMPKLKAVKTKFINKEIDFDSFEKSLHDILNLVDGGIFTSVSRAYWHTAAAEELRDVYPDSAEFIKNILRARLGRFEKAVTAYEEGRISEEELEAGIKQSSVISEVKRGRLTEIKSVQMYKMLPLESFFLFGAFPIPQDVYDGYMRQMTQRFDALMKKRVSELEEKFKNKLPAKDLSEEAKQLAMLESMLARWFENDARIKGERPYERLMIEKFDPLLTEMMSEIESAVEKPISDVEWNEIVLRAKILFGLTVNDYILKKPYSQYGGRVNRLPVIKNVFKILHKKTTGLSDLGKVNAEELLNYVKMLLDFENIIPTNAFEEYVRQVGESDIQRGERVLKLTEEFIEELRIALLKEKKIGFEEWKEIRIKLDALIMLLDGNFPVNDPSSQIPVTRRELNAAALAPALNLIQDMLWNGYAAEAPSIHDYIRLGKIVQEYTAFRIKYLNVNRPVNVTGPEFEEVLKLKEKEWKEFQAGFIERAKSSEWWKQIWESARKEFLHAEPSVVDNFVTALYAQPRVIYSGFAEDKPEKKMVYVHLKLDRLYEFYLNRMNAFKAGGDPESEMSMRLALLTINKLVDVINMQLKAEEKLDKDLSESLRLGFSKDIEKRMIDIGIVGRALPREAVPEFKELKKRSELRLQETAKRIVASFHDGRVLTAAEAVEIQDAGRDFIPVIEKEAAFALQNDELTASRGYAAILSLNAPTIVGWEFSEDGPDERLINSMVGAVRANRFISVRLMNAGKHAAKIQKLFNLSKKSSGDPVKLSMVSETGTDDLIIHHAEGRIDGALTPGLVMRPGFANAPGQLQLDSLEYANGIDRISKEDAWKVFPAGLLLLADPLSLKTSQIIKEGSTPERLSITSPAAFGVLQTIADLLSSAESRRAIASAA